MKDFLGYKDPFLSTKFGYNLSRLINPSHCIVCDEANSISEGLFCPKCYEKFLDMINAPCHICGEEADRCECLHLNGIQDIFFLFWYDKQLSSEILKKVKYLGDKREICYFGKLIEEKIKKRGFEKRFDCICYVPRTKRNLTRIGYDQSKLLAECISFYLNIPVLPCISRKGKSEEQKKLSGADRKKNVKNKFKVDANMLFKKDNSPIRNVLLIDDVITTGSTVKECSYLLRKAGIKKVYIGTIAKTPTKRGCKKSRDRQKRISVGI